LQDSIEISGGSSIIYFDGLSNVTLRVVQPRGVVIEDAVVLCGDLAELVFDEFGTRQALRREDVEDSVKCYYVGICWIDDACH